MRPIRWRRLSVVLAVLVAFIAAGMATAVPARATTPNPTCYTNTGYQNDQLYGCAASVPGEIHFYFGGYKGYDGAANQISATGKNTGTVINQFVDERGSSSDSQFFPVPADEYVGYFTVASGNESGPAEHFHFDLIVGPVAVGITANPSGQGFWTDSSDGSVKAYNGSANYGSEAGKTLNKGLVAMAATRDGQGYYLLGGDGGIFTFGDAAFYGSEGGKPLNQPVNGLAVTPSGSGYWEVASDGGIFTFGDAAFLGSMGAVKLNKPVIGMVSYGGGYTLVASDGGVFNFGTPFYGSLGGKQLAAPIMGIAPTPDGKGYWMVASDGGVFTFGDATFFGSAARSGKTIVGIAPTPDGQGYWLAASDGTVLNYGDAAVAQPS